MASFLVKIHQNSDLLIDENDQILIFSQPFHPINPFIYNPCHLLIFTGYGYCQSIEDLRHNTRDITSSELLLDNNVVRGSAYQVRKILTKKEKF